MHQWALSIIGRQTRMSLIRDVFFPSCFQQFTERVHSTVWPREVFIDNEHELLEAACRVPSSHKASLLGAWEGLFWSTFGTASFRHVQSCSYTDSYSSWSSRIWICYCSTMRNPCSWVLFILTCWGQGCIIPYVSFHPVWLSCRLDWCNSNRCLV